MLNLSGSYKQAEALMATTLTPKEASSDVTQVKWLFNKVPVYSLVVFRIIFGLAILWEIHMHFSKGWVAEIWIDPIFNFTYDGFHWVKPWEGHGMYYHFYVLTLLAFCITVGFVYRLSTILFFFGFTYVFLLEQAVYLNHFYLIVLLSFLIIFLPANRYFSVDSWLFPSLKKRSVSRWVVFILQAQVGLVYFFGGIAKLNADWLRGEPMRIWLARKTDFPLVGQWFTEDWLIYLVSYSGMLIDLLAFPFLLHKKTRVWMFLILVAFHYTNDRLFEIGIFPWFAIGATMLFFPADWPVRLYQRFKRQPLAVGIATVAGAGIACFFHARFDLVPFLVGSLTGALLFNYALPSRNPKNQFVAVETLPSRRRLIAAALGVWIGAQCAIPLRHFFIPGSVHWTGEGYQFSWHMKLNFKQGSIRVVRTDPKSGQQYVISPEDHLTRWQYQKMAVTPHMIQEYVTLIQPYYPDQEITVFAKCALNGRNEQILLDPTVNLAVTPYRNWGHQPWILPLIKAYDYQLGSNTQP
jgi:hypothetical protein